MRNARQRDAKADASVGTVGNGLQELDPLCFALYAATRALTRLYVAQLAELGLTYPQYLVLVALWERDRITITEIGDRLLLDSGTITPVVTRLERMGAVIRHRDKKDRRLVRVHLTRPGRQLKAPVARLSCNLGPALQLSPAEITALRSQIMRIVEKLGAR